MQINTMTSGISSSLGIKQYHCEFCGDAINVHQFVSGNICEQTRCRTHKALKLRRQSIAKEETQLQAIAYSFTKKTFAAPGKDTQWDVARVPFNARTIAAPQPSTLSAFRKNLRENLRAVVDSSSDSPTSRSDSAENENPHLAQACILCKGHCCAHGAKDAFLSVSHLGRVLHDNQNLSPAALYRQYIGLIPPRSYENSCVYHSEKGCNLPRPMRSDICNNFSCEKRKSLTTRLQNTPSMPIVLVAMNKRDVMSSKTLV